MLAAWTATATSAFLEPAELGPYWFRSGLEQLVFPSVASTLHVLKWTVSIMILLWHFVCHCPYSRALLDLIFGGPGWRTKLDDMMISLWLSAASFFSSTSSEQDLESSHHRIADDDDEHGEENAHNNNWGGGYCCPKRRARYWKCANRRRRRHLRRQAKEQDVETEDRKEEEKDPCPFAKFCKLHLPPPLPFMRHRRNKRRGCNNNKDNDNGLLNGSETSSAVATSDLTDSSQGPQDDREETSSKVQHGTDSKSSSSTPAADRSISDSSTSTLSSSPRRRAAVVRSSPSTVQLIDLARMQQWRAILDQPKWRRRDAKYRDGDGLYPLHWASAGGSPSSVVEKLLDTYASAAHKTDQEGSMALHFAVHYAAPLDTVQLLVKSYPQAVCHPDKYGRTPVYHAADKSASLEVLKLLVRQSPAMITACCYTSKSLRHGRPTKAEDDASTTEQPSSSGTAAVSRQDAVRTPLYLVWAGVLSDRQTRINRRGKKWDKAIWMLQMAFWHRQKACLDDQRFETEDEEEKNLLEASITMDVYLPEPTVSLILSACPECARIPDSMGRLPIAIVASTPSYSATRLRALLELLLQAYPTGASYRNLKTGRSALLECLVSGQFTAMSFLLGAVPEAAHWRDGTTGLTPAMVAGQSRRATTAPVPPQVGMDNTTSQDDMDPFHLLSPKDQVMINKKAPKDEEKSVVTSSSVLGKKMTDEDTEQLGAIFELLLANPGQLCVS